MGLFTRNAAVADGASGNNTAVPASAASPTGATPGSAANGGTQQHQQQQQAGTGSPGGSPSGIQAWIGPNLIFFVFLPYWVATGLQDTHFKLGLIIATGIAGGNIVFGALLIFVKARRVYPYVLEVAMLALFATMMGISIASPGDADVVQNNFNFITNAALAGVTLISIVVTYPLGVQHVQEQVLWVYHAHEDVINAGYVTSGVLAFAFIASCLLYLVPVSKSLQNNHMNAYNLVFRLILPEVLTFAAVLFTRVWPTSFTPNLQADDDFVWTPAGELYGQQQPPFPPLSVLDKAMLQPYPTALVTTQVPPLSHTRPHQKQKKQQSLKAAAGNSITPMWVPPVLNSQSAPHGTQSLLIPAYHGSTPASNQPGLATTAAVAQPHLQQL